MYPLPFSSVTVFWYGFLQWFTRGFTWDCSWGLVSLPWKKVGTETFQFRMEVKLRNVMFSIRPASTIGVWEFWHSPVIQDSVGSSIVDVRKTASNASFIFLSLPGWHVIVNCADIDFPFADDCTWRGWLNINFGSVHDLLGHGKGKGKGFSWTARMKVGCTGWSLLTFWCFVFF